MSTKKHIQKLLVDTRDDVIMALHDKGFGPTEIGVVINRSKQLVSHVLSKKRRIIRK